MQPSSLDKDETNKVQKMELAYQWTKDFVNKKFISIKVKFQHYDTVAKPEWNKAVARLVLNLKREIKEL